jgi:hypothetical protein
MSISIIELQNLSRSFTSPADDVALRLLNDAIEHLTTGSGGTATAIELDLVACTLRAEARENEADLMERISRELSLGQKQRRAALERQRGERRRR